MARVDDLVAQVRDERLRRELGAAVAEMKRRQRFGLVYEEHLPETTILDGLPIEAGAEVQKRNDLTGRERWRVCAVEGDTAQIEPIQGGAVETVPLSVLLTVRRFGEPIYPALKLLGETRRGEASQPAHAVINGENFHALQLLLYLYEGQADCIYLDPPYNTGARDWKYNNRYVDSSDTWRHSKWLSFMAKRLRLARRLLKPDGVLIITIDEHEVHHLGMLLEDVFPDYLRYMVTIVINPKGTAKTNFSRVDEQAIFVVPDTGDDLICDRPTNQTAFEVDEADEEEVDEQGIIDEEVEESNEEWEYQHARRRGSESSYRPQRPNQFYPIYIDDVEKTVARVGQSIHRDEEPNFERVDGLRPIWPIDSEGLHRCWRFVPASMQNELDQGNLMLGRYNSALDSWTINIKRPKKVTKKHKSVWWETIYDAGTHGTGLLRKIFGRPGTFPFPKSVYAVRDCLAAVTRNRPDALIIDVFAGSGTTYHATCLLNAEAGGQRRSVLVTNNEVEDKTATRLHRAGHYRGDAEYERHGIFEQATRPRIKAVTIGKRPDGTVIPGNYAGGRAFAKGFPENVAFFKLDYLDADAVDLNLQFWSIAPALWLAAGGVGALPVPSEDASGFFLPPACPFGVLFSESRFRAFGDALRARPDVRHVWLVTDSETAYAEMRAALPPGLNVGMLYRDYLRNFRINTERNL